MPSLRRANTVSGAPHLTPRQGSFASLADAVYADISLPRRDEAIERAAEDIYHSTIERVTGG